MSDNEDATAALGDSEVSRVKDSPRPPIPEVIQSSGELSEVSSSGGIKETWLGDVLQEEPSRTCFCDESHPRP
jgi:hypothetical protein